MSSPSFKYINKLQRKRVLIFGGTSGIGFAVAEGCIEYGATVIITGSNAEKLQKTVQRLKTSYPNITESQLNTYACDLSDVDHLDENIESLLSTVTQGGQTKLNHVVFTAGDRLSMPKLAEITVALVEKNAAVRTIAPMIIARHLLTYLEKSPDSSFSLTSGVNAAKPMPGWSVPASRAAGGEGFAKGLAVDMAPIRVNVVSPGAIKTELFANFPEEVSNEWGRKTLVKRLGRPEDTAEAYLYLMKDGFVTGTRIDTNGGRLLV